MIYPEIFGDDIWVIPNGANQLFLIKLPEYKDKEPMFGNIKYHERNDMLMAHLNPSKAVEMKNESPPVLHMLYKKGNYETEMSLFSLNPLKNVCVEIEKEKFFLTSYEAGFVPTAQGHSDANALFKKQLIIELALAWQQKQDINLSVRFGALFERLFSDKQKEVKPKSKLILPDNKLILN